jgi:hypothetical protein
MLHLAAELFGPKTENVAVAKISFKPGKNLTVIAIGWAEPGTSSREDELVQIGRKVASRSTSVLNDINRGASFVDGIGRLIPSMAASAIKSIGENQ